MRHAAPVFVREMARDGAAMDGDSVRVVGRLASFDPSTALAILTDDSGAHVAVDTTLVDPVQGRIGELLMVLGEVEVDVGVGAGEEERPYCVLVVPRSCVEAFAV
ncbi:hypothetical protein M427DRAFT_34527 [Gonapodya prolifera JEL478]|uniref:Replication factor A protein 3 n=1 Tax=Gonapodya prolifera (strain JEL478) TaxID=1344416 RepID=A0A139A7M5_GONPJ|nr:hypothetical protein M427DRAFT_34527 [Gonapodya prolifera JEL478]|eukprot:KXS12689.1 hypothetical protein M427DRAFT_34527 [Gonapodya prolifera JEL478]